MATNDEIRVKDVIPTIDAFRTGDKMLIDGPSGTANMSKDTLLQLTAQNALAGNVAPAFDPTRTSENPYLAGETVVYGGARYIFKVDHYGPWSSSDVSLLSISKCLDIDNDSNYLYNDNNVLNLNIQDRYINANNGTLSSSTATDWTCSDFVKVPSLKLHYHGYCGYDATCIAYYDQNKNFISYQGWDNRIAKTWDFDLVYPKNAAYFRASAYAGSGYTYNISAVSKLPGIESDIAALHRFIDIDNDSNYLYNDNYTLGLEIQSKYINGSDGTQSSSTATNWACSDFVKVPSLKLHYNGYVGFDVTCIAYYDQNKNFISSQGFDGGSIKAYDFDLVYPKNAAYFRASAYVGSGYTYNISAVSRLPQIESDIKSMQVDASGNYNTYEHTGYLKADGSYSTGGAKVSVNASVSVKEGDQFTYSGTYGYSACAFITKHEGTVVQHYGDNAEGGQSVPAIFTVPSGVDEILFSSYATAGTTPVITVKKVNSVYEICQNFNDRLLGKKIVFDGDSIGAASEGWARRIGEAHSMDWHNVAVSGGTICSDTYYFTAITGSPDWSNTYYVRNNVATSTLDLYVQVTESTWDGHSTLYTKGSARHWESTYIETIHSNYPALDYIIFESCLNDMFNGVPKGELSSGYTGTFETTKFIPALEHLFQRAITLYPQAKLGMIIPHMTSSWETQKTWAEIAVSVCKKWAIPYINLFEKSGLVYPMTSQQGVLYSDTAHLLPAGYDFITPKIESWIASL